MTRHEAGRRTLSTAAAAFVMMQMTGMQVRAQETPTGSGKGDAQVVVGDEDEPKGGGDVVEATAETQDPGAEALVLVATSIPPTETEGDDGQDVTEPEKNPLENKTKETAAPAQLEMTTETPTSEAPVELVPETTEPAVVMETTTKPSLRTQDPAVISDAVTNDAAKTQAPGYLSQGTNPLVLVALAAICCVFLLLWGRKRRSSAATSSSTSGGAGFKGPKVQYKQVPDEQPFSHNQDDDDEYCDDYEEDTFANDRDNWDDWEGNSTQTQVSQLNPFAAPPSAPRPTTPRQSNTSPSPFKLSQPLPPPPQQQHHAPHQEIAIASTGDLLPSSVESNSSSESFEVVTEEEHAPPTGSRSVAADEEKETESVDDLFSQFGMVPTFKKSALVPPPPPAATSAAPVSQAATTETLSSSSSSLPTAAEASALFAVEMDDELTAVDAADEWGEDDEWVKGI